MLRPDLPIAAGTVRPPTCTSARVFLPGAARTTIVDALRLAPALVFCIFLTCFCFARDFI